MKRTFGIWLGLMALTAGCGGDDNEAGGTATTATNSSSTSDGMESTNTSSGSGSGEESGDEEEETGDDPTTSGSGFVTSVDGMTAGTCDIWSQDCPDGEKCVPYGTTGSQHWDANGCTPVTGDKQVGDECSKPNGGLAPEDDCAKGLFCYFEDEGTGLCVEVCGGTNTNPSCAPGFDCTIQNDGMLVYCSQQCDPLVQDCPPNTNTTCLEAVGGQGFSCALGWNDGAIGVGESCRYRNSCVNGARCIYEEGAVPNCMAGGENGCCTSWCDLDLADPGCLEGQDCVAWFDSPVPGYQTVGICLVPS